MDIFLGEMQEMQDCHSGLKLVHSLICRKTPNFPTKKSWRVTYRSVFYWGILFKNYYASFSRLQIPVKLNSRNTNNNRLMAFWMRFEPLDEILKISWKKRTLSIGEEKQKTKKKYGLESNKVLFTFSSQSKFTNIKFSDVFSQFPRPFPSFHSSLHEKCQKRSKPVFFQGTNVWNPIVDGNSANKSGR